MSQELRTVHVLLGCKYCAGRHDSSRYVDKKTEDEVWHFLCPACGYAGWEYDPRYVREQSTCTNPYCGEEIMWLKN